MLGHIAKLSPPNTRVSLTWRPADYDVKRFSCVTQPKFISQALRLQLRNVPCFRVCRVAAMKVERVRCGSGRVDLNGGIDSKTGSLKTKRNTATAGE